MIYGNYIKEYKQIMHDKRKTKRRSRGACIGQRKGCWGYEVRVERRHSFRDKIPEWKLRACC